MSLMSRPLEDGIEDGRWDTEVGKADERGHGDQGQAKNVSCRGIASVKGEASRNEPNRGESAGEAALRTLVWKGPCAHKVTHAVVVDQVERMERQQRTHEGDRGQRPQHYRGCQHYTSGHDDSAKHRRPSQPGAKFLKTGIVKTKKALSLESTANGCWVDHRGNISKWSTEITRQALEPARNSFGNSK